MQKRKHPNSFSERVRQLGFDTTKAHSKFKRRLATEDEFLAALVAGTIDDLPYRSTGNSKTERRQRSQASRMADAGVSKHTVRYVMRRFGLDFDAALETAKNGLPKKEPKQKPAPKPSVSTARGEANRLGVKETEVRIIAKYMNMSYADAAQRIRDKIDGKC